MAGKLGVHLLLGWAGCLGLICGWGGLFWLLGLVWYCQFRVISWVFRSCGVWYNIVCCRRFCGFGLRVLVVGVY